VRTSSLLEGWNSTPMTRALRATASEPQEKLPDSRRRPRYFVLPPRVRTRWIRLVPIRVWAG